MSYQPESAFPISHYGGIFIQEHPYDHDRATDGVYAGSRYFSCRENHGLFVSIAELWVPLDPLAHSYLLLEDSAPYSRGAVMVLGPHKDSYKEHSHLWDLNDTTIYCNSDEVAPLTEEECVLLDGIEDCADRHTVYSTPGRLAWGVGLKVGDDVLARLPGREEHAASIIQCVGVDTENGKRMLFGVEIKVSLY